ncbi:MAG TPA: hypothetical protein VGK74_12640 [Symbiobacteriaceae bacterium]|jgi:hypothetical protein
MRTYTPLGRYLAPALAAAYVACLVWGLLRLRPWPFILALGCGILVSPRRPVQLVVIGLTIAAALVSIWLHPAPVLWQ